MPSTPYEEMRSYRELIENAGDAIASFSLDGTFLEVNRGAEALLGWTREEMIGQHVSKVATPVSVALAEERTRCFLAGEQLPPMFEAELICKDGKLVPVEARTWAFRDNAGQLAGFHGIFRDLTVRKRMEEALRKSEAALQSERQLFIGGPVIVFKWQAAGQWPVTYVSPNVTQLGYTPEELLNGVVSYLELIHPEDRDRVVAKVHAYTSAGTEAFEQEYRLRRADGQLRWIYDFTHLCKNVDGEVTHRDGYILDITERKRTEERFREEAEINAALVGVAREMIASLDTSAVLDRLCRLTTEVLDCDCGHTLLWFPEEEIYRNVAGYGNTPEQWETLRAMKIPRGSAVALASQMLKDDGVVEVEESTAEPGSLLTMLMHQSGLTASLIVPLRRGESVIGALTASYRGRRGFSDRQKRLARGLARITSLALANAQLLEEIERSNHIKEDFVSTMSHELRTPLNIMLGYNQLLREETFGPLTVKQMDVIDRVQKTAHELLEMVNTTLDLNRLQSRRVPLEIQAVQIPEFMRELEVEAQQLNRKPHLQLQWEIPPNPPVLRTDPVKVKIVLKNLLTNALKFTETGAISVRVETQEHGVAFIITDTGPGIAPEELTVIFEPFRQGGEFATRSQGGVGLGLYIVRQLLELLNGKISVTSEVGKGSAFRVWLPGEGARNAGA
ncbi:MAG: PAS domain S-box protein [Candidatus Binatia bacterium]